MQGLMMEEVDPQPCTDASSHSCHDEQCGFGNAPFAVFVFTFVDAYIIKVMTLMTIT
jgi:hypothetical protein